tara:strand:+ start:809 stop:1147 length:339 start_codon:yes stop_codon:yes gene_type:complete
MGSVPKKIFKAVVKKPLRFAEKKVVKPVLKAGGEVFEEVVEKPFKKVTEEVGDTVMGTDKTDRRPNDKPTVSKKPAPSKVTTPAQKLAQGGLSRAEQRRLMQRNKAFKQTKI